MNHRNTGRSPHNKTPDSLKKRVQSLIKDKYYDVNLQHLAELMDRNDGIQIKRETLRTWAHEIHHVKRAKRRRTQARKKNETEWSLQGCYCKWMAALIAGLAIRHRV